MPTQTPASPTFKHEALLPQALLIYLTLGLYMLWWLYRQSRVINSHAPALPIPSWVMHVAIVSVLALLPLRLSLSMEPNNTLPAALLLLVLLSTAVLMFWILLVRRGINQLSGANFGEPNWISLPIALALSLVQLSPVYMQHVINRVLASRGKR